MPDWFRWLLIALAVLGGVALTARRRLSLPAFPQVRAGIAASVLVWLAIAVVVAGAAGGGLLWFLGWPRLPTTGAFDVTQLLDLLKIALSVVAGLGGVVLLAVNYRKQRVTENEHALAVEKAERETVQGFNERLGAAAEQLAHESPAVRLTGVYALAGLADDWVDKRQVCIDVLCGYLRLQPGTMTPGESVVREAILRMFRDRLTGLLWWRHPVDFDFTEVVFENADFSGLRFRGRLILDRAEFTGQLTSFDRARFSGGLSCHGTRFAAERTSFGSVLFDGGIEFVGAEFTGQELSWAGSTVRGGATDFYRCRVACKRLDFTQLSIEAGEVRFEQMELSDTEVDFKDLDAGWQDDSGGFPRLVFEDVRFTRGRLRLELWSERERMIWLRDCSLDAVAVELNADDDAKPWLNLRDVELRGGTEIPAEFVRTSSAPRPSTPAPEA
ncbi:pentapeptide repeat-containing protein [Amycolatopsis sp. SID8362]|uniref:pentapeptide repeat-containing protein n=1 Tax=Amycolatopsis sp. SID8362 TaxID=2690346 RepID=UPI0013711B1B|nr:pentapeptide repeat-containing protein [Amycolatopsis sp. SID8362]NBH05354.1 hypothetical protein [Amycolatopsis sp. SID8362]NED42054.1 hypothetical protein [Amycolatopsis sp. SID8362]